MFNRLSCLIVLFSLSCEAIAQDAPKKSGTDGKPQASESSRNQHPQVSRSDRDFFFRTLSGMRSQEFTYLLFQKSVCEEIGLDKTNAKKVHDVVAQTRTSIGQLFEQLRDGEITVEALKSKMLEQMYAADREVWKILVDSNAKTDRLLGLFVQHRNSASVINKAVAEKIGLDDSRRQEILAKKESLEREIFEKDSREDGNAGDRMRNWEKARKKIDGMISGMLTPEQREKLEKLKGDAFKFEEFSFPLGPPPGRGRGDGGRGDGGRDGRRDGDNEKKCCESEMFVSDQ